MHFWRNARRVTKGNRDAAHRVRGVFFAQGAHCKRVLEPRRVTFVINIALHHRCDAYNLDAMNMKSVTANFVQSL